MTQSEDLYMLVWNEETHFTQNNIVEPTLTWISQQCQLKNFSNGTNYTQHKTKITVTISVEGVNGVLKS